MSQTHEEWKKNVIASIDQAQTVAELVTVLEKAKFNLLLNVEIHANKIRKLRGLGEKGK